MRKTARKKLYQCPICKLHYSSKLWAKKCENWCKKHDSCNLTITTHSVERQKEKPSEKPKHLRIKRDKNYIHINFIKTFRNFSIALFILVLLYVSYVFLQENDNLYFRLFHKSPTGYITNGNYSNRKLIVFEEVNPKDGFQSKIVLGNIIPKLVSLGVINIPKMQQIYQGRGGIPKEEMALLTKSSSTQLVINGNNANWIVNLLWAIGLSNKMEINKQSPVYGPDVNSFASTGGWTLGKEDNGGAYFNKYSLLSLTLEQQKRVKMIADNAYRPCCNNSTFFQDCNHGSAAMALIELGVSQGLSDQEIYKTLLAFNAFWFPQNYNELALYFNVVKNTDWHDVDPKVALSKNYSSVGGWMANVDTKIAKVPNLLPKPQNSGSCGA